MKKLSVFVLIAALLFCSYEYGKEVGYSLGYDAGYEAGETKGYNDGHKDGFLRANAIHSGTFTPTYKSSSSYWSYSDNASKSEPQSVTVYVTRTGEKYHKSGCQYLANSKIPMEKNIAINKGYTPCSRCW